MSTCRPRGTDAGSTLVELIVVMFILSFVVVTTVTLTIGMQRTTAQTISRQDQIDIGRTAVERMSRTLRTAVKPSQLDTGGGTADAFIKAEDFAIQFYGNLDNPDNSVGPSRIGYTLATTGPSAGVLVEKVQVPDSNVPGVAGYEYCDAESAAASAACVDRLTVRTIAEGIKFDTGAALFRYFNETGAELSTSGVGLAADELSHLLSVEMTLTVQSTGAAAPAPTTYIQRVLLPNSDAVLRP